MSHREEIDTAVVLAHRAATAGQLAQTPLLTRFLYQRWYLGRAPRRVGTVPGQRPSRPRQPWRAWGPLWNEHRTARGSDLVRLHLSCAPHTSLHAVTLVSQRAQKWDHPWLLTSRAITQAVPSADATVLYLPAAALSELQDPLRHLIEELRPFLASSVPALTLRIGRGASLAQNPADGRSYGEHRCSLIADTVLANLHHPHPEIVKKTRLTFLDAEVDPRRPYRSLGANWEWQVRTAA